MSITPILVQTNTNPSARDKSNPGSGALAAVKHFFYTFWKNPGFWIFVLCILARAIPGVRSIDDSFITFRYARNLLSGIGFAYNPGEAVLGTTTPLFTLLMAGLGAVTGGTQAPFPTLALAVNALSDGLTCLLLIRLGQRLGFRWAGWGAALYWAIAPYSVTFAIGGMETSLYVALLTAMVVFSLEHRHGPAALCASLALLTRPDALILIGPLVLDRLYRAWRQGERLEIAEALLFILPVAAWYSFAALNFGSPLPHSVTAKLVAYRLGANEALIRLLQHYATPFHQQNWIGSAAGVAVGLALFPFLSILGALRALRREPHAWPFAAYPALYFVTMSLPNPLIFRWYLTPPLPAYVLLIFGGIERLLGDLFKRSGRPAAARVATAALMGILLLTTASEWRLALDHGPARPAPEMAWIKLELLYRQAAGLVAPQMTASSTLAAGDVGVLGFYTPGKILDTVGLNSSQSTGYYPLPASDYVINYAIPTRLILDEQPDFFITLEVYVRNTLLQDAAFQQEYQQIAALPTDIYGSKAMLIYKKKK